MISVLVRGCGFRVGSIAVICALLAAPPAAAAGAPRDGTAREALIGQVGSGHVRTGILYDLVAPLSGIERFDGSEAARPASLRDWKQLYHELYRASLD
ncbi:MAG: hypothetical protein PHQ19_04410, partial [Candidatus Krumholzibacteria bacterium]|nr:hypothetical protein [Candidatus Krumholzibacteria bacterium]